LVAVLTLAGVTGWTLPIGAEDAPPQPLPLKQVALFSSGVGYFQRSGTVRDAGTVDLSFPKDKVNDILKSLVLLDPQGGARGVAYTAPDALGRRLSRSGRALTPNVSLGTLLAWFQGARIRLTVSGGQQVEGRLVSVSQTTSPVKDAGVLESDVLNVLTEEGLRALPLGQVQSVKLLDERLDRELRESLEQLGTGLDDERETVQLQFAGNGARKVKAGYLQEMPVWKTSYRLVLEKGQKPHLQGWAIVENTTDEDWKDVRLSLVSGRPISFIQDLKQPLYLPRPIVEAQVIGSPTPQAYRESLTLLPSGVQGLLGYPLDNSLLVKGDADRKVSLTLNGVPLRAAIQRLFSGTGYQYSLNPDVRDVPITLTLRDVALQPALRMIIREAATMQPGLTFSKDGEIFVVKIRRENPNPHPVVEDAPPEFSDVEMLKRAIRSVPSLATGAERGALFSYDIKLPVTLNRGQAAMVPIVSATVDGESVSIFDPESDRTHALRGFRLKNTTGLHLSGGPITVYQDGGYAGDAQVSYLQPGEDRLLSYAVDLDLVADLEAPRIAATTASVTARDGVLLVTRKQREERLYRFRNQSTEPRTVIVQQRKVAGWKLAGPEKPVEETPDELRFRLQIPASNTGELKVTTEEPLSQKLVLADVSVDLIVSYAQNAEVPEKLRAGLKQLAALRRKQSELQELRSGLDAELKAIDTDQARIRQNMQSLDRTSALYQSYVTKLTEQEAHIEKLRTEIKRLAESEKTLGSDIRTFLDALTLE